MEDSDGKSHNGLKIGGATLFALAAAGYFGAEKIAKTFVDEPGAQPAIPSEPQRVTAQRPPIHLGLGIDVSPSDISKKLPTVIGATRQFMQSGGILRAGDRVTACTFAERASCESFQLPAESQRLLALINRIATERRSGIETHVERSIAEIVEMVKREASENALIAVWTDAKDEGPDVGDGSVFGETPVRIIIPDERFQTDAKKVKNGLSDGDVRIAVASTGQQFGDTLRDFTEGLERDVRAQAQAREDARYGQAMSQYHSALARHETDIRLYQEALAKVHEKIERVKTWIHRIIGSIVGLFTILAFLDYRERTRPRISGYIVKKGTGTYDRTFPLPRSKKPVNIRRMAGLDIILSPSKQGVTLDGRVLQDGEQIAEGVFYHMTDPRIRKSTKRS